MLKRIGFVFGALVVGIVAGVGAALLMIHNGAMIGRVENHLWFTNRSIGSVDADPYTRALVARVGLLGLNRSEAIYYTRSHDEAGAEFEERCTYRIDGGPLAARWWSITLYAPDNFLAINGDDHPSIDATSVTTSADGSWSATIAPDRGDAVDWISSRNGGTFRLSIRLYNPGPEIGEHMADVNLPRVTRESCRGEEQ